MRPLSRTDHSRSHLSVLSVLTSTPDLTEEQYAQAFASLRACPDTYFTLVIVNRETDAIVGVGTVFLEQKFTRGLGKVGHIEDIAVDKSMQGRKLGLRIIQALTGISERVGCYKTILNCSDKNVREYPGAELSSIFVYPMLIITLQLSMKSADSKRKRVRWPGTTTQVPLLPWPPLKPLSSLGPPLLPDFKPHRTPIFSPATT